MKKILFIFFLLFTCHLSLVTQVKAQSALGLTAIPPRLEIEGDPGQVVTKEIKVRNESLQNRVIYTTIKDFIVSDDSGTPLQLEDTDLETNPDLNRWTASSWIHISPTKLQLKPGETKSLTLTVIVPDNALPGGHYAMLTYMPNGDVKPGQMKKTASIIGQRVGTLIYFTVAGPVTEKLNILKFSVPQFSEQGPINFTGTLESLSDIHITPVGNITISDPLRTKVAEVPVEAGSVFPETQRDFVSTWTQKWGWGKYRADLNLAYGTTGAVATATIFFWLFPIRLVIYSLIAIISILTAIILLNKRSKRHQEMLEKEVTELKEELEKLEESKK